MQVEDWLVDESGGPIRCGGRLRSTKTSYSGRKTASSSERDLDIALSLTTLVHNEYQEFGTSGRNVLDDQDIAVAQRALVVVLHG